MSNRVVISEDVGSQEVTRLPTHSINNKIIYLESIKSSIMNHDLFFLLKACLQINIDIKWYYKQDIYYKNAFNIWQTAKSFLKNEYNIR